MQFLQICESGVVLEEIAFDFSDSVVPQTSGENERINVSEMRTFHAIFTPLASRTSIEVERDL